MTNKIKIRDYNSLVPHKYRKKLNSQRNITKLTSKVNEKGEIIQPFRCIVGLGERHFQDFDERFQKFIDIYPWLKKKHARFIMNELLINSQFSCLRDAVTKIQEKKHVVAYMTITIHVNKDFLTTTIEEYGDYFDYFSYIENNSPEESETMYDHIDEYAATNREAFYTDGENVKLILRHDNTLIVPDQSNKLALKMIEQATDYDFYVTSYYKNDHYMWKRIYFRLEND